MRSYLAHLPDRHVGTALIAGVALLTGAACSSGADDRGSRGSDTAAATTPATSAAPMPDTAHSAAAPQADSATAAMTGMAPMTGDADRDFLRMMSDHHKALVSLAHETLEKKGAITVKDDAKALDRKQDEEIDRMGAMLRQYYEDSYVAKAPPESKSMIDAVMAKSGAAFDRAFRLSVIKHHQDALRMIDQYLPKLTKPDVKAMAQKMKTDQGQEIAVFQKKLGQS